MGVLSFFKNIPLAAGGLGAAALATPEEAEAGTLSTGRQMQEAAEMMALGRARTPEERAQFMQEQQAMRDRGDFDYIRDMTPTELGRELDKTIGQLGAGDQVFLTPEEIRRMDALEEERRRQIAEDEVMSNRSVGAIGAGGAGALALGDEIIGAGKAVGSLGHAVLTGIGAEGQALLGALSPFLSTEEALAYAERARARPPMVSTDPNAQPYLDIMFQGADYLGDQLGQFGDDVGRGFGRQSPLYQGIPAYRMAYDEAARVGGALGDLYDEYAPERLKLGLGALYNLNPYGF